MALQSKQREEKAISAIKTTYSRVGLSEHAKHRIRAGFWKAVDAENTGRRYLPFLRTASALMALSVLLLVVIIVASRADKSSTGGDEYVAVIISPAGSVATNSRTGAVRNGRDTRFTEGETLTAERPLTLTVGPHRIEGELRTELTFSELKESSVRLSLKQGKISLSVAPLPPGGQLIVETAHLSVRVVGTVFTVSTSDDCTEVSVSKGRVDVYEGETDTRLIAGESRTVCEVDEPSVPEQAPSSPEALDDSKETQEPPRAVKKRPTRSNNRVKKISSKAAALSLEERVFMDAQTLVRDNKLERAAERFSDYLKRFPTGMFAEESLFQLNKTFFKLGRYREAEKNGAAFLKQFSNASLYRIAQVRLLCAQIHMEQYRDAASAWNYLSPLAQKVDALSGAMQKQLISLMLKSACEANQEEVCNLWAGRYIERYPNGTLAEYAKKQVTSSRP